MWGSELEQAREQANALRLLSLLEHDPTTSASYGQEGEGWFTLHPLLHSYALGLLKGQPSEYVQMLQRYEEYIIKIAEGFWELGPEEWEALTPYLPHIEQVGGELVAQVNAKGRFSRKLLRRAQHFAINTSHYMNRRREVRHPEWTEMGLAVSRKLQDQQQEARFLGELGKAALAYGEMERAQHYHQQALALYQAIQDREGEAGSLHALGNVYLSLGEPTKALKCYEQALPVSRELGKRKNEAITLTNIGLVYNTLGEYDKALEFFEQALPLTRAVGDRRGEAITLTNIGLVSHNLEDKAKALEYYEQALPLWRAVGDWGGEGSTCWNIALLYYSLGELETVLEYMSRSAELYEQVSHPNRQEARQTLAQWQAELEARRKDKAEGPSSH